MRDEYFWQPSASIEFLRQRARFIAKIREFFSQNFYLEVETPIMAHHGVTDAYLSNIKAEFRSQSYYLQTSPEYHMKRLLAAGSGPIFQLARVFRDDELGRWHNPEFTLLEWYQLNIDHHALINEMDLFLQTLVHSKPLMKVSYEEIVLESCRINPFTASIAELQQVLKRYDLDKVLAADELNKDQYLFLLMSHVVEPFMATIDVPIAVYNFPPSQAALAQINNGVAERFEIYYRGVELANGFHELCDVKAQERRFKQDLDLRQELGLTLPTPDAWLLQALEEGLPSCSGVALGVDRLLALAMGCSSISEVMSFDVSRA